MILIKNTPERKFKILDSSLQNQEAATMVAQTSTCLINIKNVDYYTFKFDQDLDYDEDSKEYNTKTNLFLHLKVSGCMVQIKWILSEYKNYEHDLDKLYGKFRVWLYDTQTKPHIDFDFDII